MKPSQENIDEIIADFAEMKTRDDLLQLLNKAKRMYYGEKAVPFELKSLTYFSNPKLAKNRYREFSIRKKSGGQRSIHSPAKGLKAIQRILSFIFQCVFEPHDAANGFVWGKSISSNAFVHAGNHYVYNIDLKDFFPGIDFRRVQACFKLPPFNLNAEREPLSFLLANLCCTELEVERSLQGKTEKQKLSVLPQGAPTSPVITNIVCRKLDRRLAGLAKRFNLNYSRYADDITFSSKHNVYSKSSEFIRELHRIIEDQNFRINPGKTRLQRDSHCQVATGLVVNEKVNVRRRYVKRIRSWLYLWETYGFQKAEDHFRADYLRDKNHQTTEVPDIRNVLSGKLDFLRMIRGSNDEMFKKLHTRFMTLFNKELGIPGVNQILDVWEAEGIEKAIEYSNIKTD